MLNRDPALNQYKGTNPITGLTSHYQLDQNGNVYAIFDESADAWVLAQDVGGIEKPTDLSEALNTEEKGELAAQMLETGLFRKKTQYILIGDEPSGGSGVVNLQESFGEEDYKNLKKFLTFMPRQLLREFFMQKIWPDLPWTAFLDKNSGPPSDAVLVRDPIYGTSHYKKNYEDMVWAAFLDVFNEANLEHINQEQIEPWTWESQKMEGYYLSQDNATMQNLEVEFAKFRDISLETDPKAKAIMEQFATLTKLGDVGLEITRQNAVKELLKMKEYQAAQAVVDAYRYAEQTEVGEAMKEPIPFDIKLASGEVVAKATKT